MSDADSPVDSPVDHRDDARDHDEDEQSRAENDSDAESDVLSEVDEEQFEDYDPEKAQIEERPINIDEDMAKTLKASKRKRTDGTDGAAKKPKEGRRAKKRRTGDDDGDEDPDGVVLEGKRIRNKGRPDGGERKPRKTSPKEAENEENLTPEERRRRAIDRAIDASLKKPKSRRTKKDEVVCLFFFSDWHPF